MPDITGGPFTISAELYHADNVGAPTPSLSSHLAHVLVTQSPFHAWCQHPRLGAQETESSTQMDDGSAAHAVLFGERDRLFSVNADNWRTKAAQTARDEARAAGLIPILSSQLETFEAMAKIARKTVADCEDFAELDGLSLDDGDAEQTLLWCEESTPPAGETQRELPDGDVVWCRARLDWLKKDRTIILDYKTTSGVAEPTTWSRKQIAALGYDLQAALYRRGNAMTGGPEALYFWLVQETDPPYGAAIVGLMPRAWELAEEKRIEAVRLWGKSLARNYWPGYQKKIAYFDMPAYEETRWAERMTVRGW